MDPISAPTTARRPPMPDRAALRAQAAQLEGLLFSEMLRAAGTRSPGGRDSPFDGLLRDAQAQSVAAAGRTGLTDAIVASIERRAW